MRTHLVLIQWPIIQEVDFYCYCTVRVTVRLYHENKETRMHN